MQLPVNALAKQKMGEVLEPSAIHMGDFCDAPSFWFQTGPALALTIWRMNQQKGDLSLALSLFSLSASLL